MPALLTPSPTAALLLAATQAGTESELVAVCLAIDDLQVMIRQGYISHVRKLAGVSQEALAAALGISQPAISQYEHDLCPVPASLALKLHSLVRALESTLVAEGKLSLADPTEPGNYVRPPAVVPAPTLVR